MRQPYVGRINLQQWFGDQRDDFIVNFCNPYCDFGWYDRMPAAVILGPTRSAKSSFIQELICSGLKDHTSDKPALSPYVFVPNSWGKEVNSRFTWSAFDEELHKVVVTEETLNFYDPTNRRQKDRLADPGHMKEILNCQGFSTDGILHYCILIN